MQKHELIQSTLLILILVSSGACLKVQEVVPLKERAAVYWELRASEETMTNTGGVPVRLYDEFVCAQSKARLSERVFLKQQSLAVENPQVVKVEKLPDGIHGTVTVRFDTQMKGIKVSGVTVKEDWILENGKWMVIVPEPKNPFRRKLL